MKNRKAERAWIVVADASQAKLYEAAGKDAPRLIESLEHPPSREQGRDLHGNRPNALQDSDEKLERNSPGSLQDVEAERFARTVVQRLERGRADHAFDLLAIAAAPQFLGMLRDQMSKPLLEKVVRTEPKRRLDAAPEDLMEGLLGR